MTFTGNLIRAGALLVAVGLAGFGAVALGQDGAPPPPPPGGHHRGFGGPMSDDMMRFIGFEAGLGGKTVTGAPFTASFLTTETQTLADGNVINLSTSGSLARDSQGRTRRDMTLPAIGRFATSSGQSTPPHVVLINDVVAGSVYILQPDQKVAHKEVPPNWPGRNRQGQPGPDADAANSNPPNVTSASLGTQTINGVVANGTRVTRTIPAGEVGNEKPIVITTERWYSPDLQTFVMVKRSDPYVGQTEFQLTNIQRQEPDASLFQVPSDYTVQSGGRQKGHGHGLGPGMPPPDGPPPPQE